MKLRFLKRILVLVLTLCTVLTMIPLGFSHNDVEAVSGIDSLTCSSFISNSIARNYIDKMMRYYINNNSSLRTSLDNGQSIIFMFEGGSDNYWSGSDYTKSDYDVRNQAVCIVVKKNSSGNAYIAFYNESSCSIPGDPSWCTGAAYSGSTTLMDGTYGFYTTNHTGPYAAFQVDLYSTGGNCYYTPPASPNGYKNGASGINIHTRSTNIAGGQSLGWVWSAGCQLISWGNDTGNEFNAFMKAVCGITWNAWINYSSKTFNTWSSANMGIYKGYYVVDRQLGLMNASGTKYGSGSLINLYNKTALTNITAKSTAAAAAAGADKVDYLSQCTYYPAYGTVKITGIDVWTRTLPCYNSTDSTSSTISVFDTGQSVTITGLYKNTLGEYWYRTTSPSGSTVYFNGAYADYVSQNVSDIKFTGHNPPNGHVKATGYAIDGDISTQYNRITNVSAYVYKGLGTSGENLTGTSATVSTTSYKLAGSAVDEAVWMSVPDNGPHTLQISMQYINYYVAGGVLKSNTGIKVLATDYFMVIPSAVSQSTCSHSYKNYILKEGTCTVKGESIEGCTICGHMKAKVTTSANHSYGNWEVVTDSTCTTEGVKTRTCTKCGNKESQKIPFGGHNYTSKSLDATCVDYKRIQYTCLNCSDTYSEYADSLLNWTETKPVAEEGRVIEEKTQYRYSDYSTSTSYNSTLEGYTVEKTEWVKDQSGSIKYVKSWPSGFNTSNSLYSTYNKTPKTAVTNTNDKTTIDSDSVTGYIYYHWCYANSYYSVANKSGDYTTFHAYYSTTPPSSYDYDTGDWSYKTSHSTCSDSPWYFAIEVNQQNYTTYKKLYTHSRWSDWSQWSDVEVTPSNTRKVETRTLYRSVKPSDLGSHVYVNGTCSACGRVQPDFYLFGFINGADYACEADAENIGIYKFVDGKLTATFTENSYVAFKTGDNLEWFMTDGYPGDSSRTAVFYNTNKGINADKLFVPKGVEVDFTLVDNGDGSFTLSYDLSKCDHKNHNTNGNCTVCGTEVSHTFESGVCTVCGKPAPIYYLYGFINGADYDDMEYRFVNGTLKTKFTENSYVALKLADGSVRYMTDTYLGEDVTSAVLFDSEILGENADKLFVPGGKNITFTLVDNGDNTFTLSYEAVGCAHTKHDINGVCTSCGAVTEHTFVDGDCSGCGFSCSHPEYDEDNLCTVCRKEKPSYYLFGFINGEDYNGLDYPFVNGKLVVTFTDTTYIAVKTKDNSNWYMTDTYQGDDATMVQLYNTKILDGRGDKLFIPKGREITFLLVDNGDDTFTLSYAAAKCMHETHNVNGVCLSCGEIVEHTLVDGNCTICGNNCQHIYESGFCTECQKAEPTYHLNGFINGGDYYGDEFAFENGILVTTFSTDSYIYVVSSDRMNFMTDGYLGEDTTSALLYNSAELGESADKLFVPANRQVIIVLVDNGNNTLTIAYNLGECKHTSHNEEGVCLDCDESVIHNFFDGFCTVCKRQCEHNYENRRCTVCGMREPDYYLFGTINGSTYACDEDAENMGVYRFVDGKLNVLFATDSFVGVKTSDNLNWYMTDSYLGDKVTSALLYNTKMGINADKLFIPGGRFVTLYLVNNNDGTLSITCEIAPCSHTSHDEDGICYVCKEQMEHSFNNGVCSVCSKNCEHNYVDGLCSVCRIVCNHIWIEGECTRCSAGCNHTFENGICSNCKYECIHNFVSGVCTSCSTVCVHNWIAGICYNCHDVCEHTYKDGKCIVCAGRCNHNYVNGICTVCSVVCVHKFHDGMCLVCDEPCVHNFVNSVCTVCDYACEHVYTEGKCVTCKAFCEHKWTNGVCKVCSFNCSHSFVNSKCDICSVNCTHYYVDDTCIICSKKTEFYLVGSINGKYVGCEEDYQNLGTYKFVNDILTVTFTQDSFVCLKTADNLDWYMAEELNTGTTTYIYNTKSGAGEFIFIPAGVKAQFVLSPLENDCFKLSYTVEGCTHSHHDVKGRCFACGESVEHNFVGESCAECSAKKPMKDMYLFGVINGADYGYNADAETIGTYKFTDKKLTATFAEDSFVALKSFDNTEWYMTEAEYMTGTSAVMYNTMTGLAGDLMFVPGGVEVHFTLRNNGDGSFVLNYEIVDNSKPQISVKYATLDTEEFRYSLCFTAKGIDAASDQLGLIVFDENTEDATLENADVVINTVTADKNGFIVKTDSIAPQYLADTVYMRVFVISSDGTVTYSEVISYDAVRYANGILSSKYSTESDKAKAVSLLNFISAAQKYNNYNTESLANAGLSEEQNFIRNAAVANSTGRESV